MSTKFFRNLSVGYLAHPMPVPIRGRESYYRLRSQIRRLKKEHPSHMDVLWYEEGLGLQEVSDRVVIRYTAFGGIIHAISLNAPRPGTLP